MVHTYSWKETGDIRLSNNIMLHEVRCSDGSDEIKIDDAVIIFAQQIRDHFKKPLTITCGYRTVAYNEALIRKGYKASRNSQHLVGKALDIEVKGVSPATLYKYADSLIGSKGGVGIYSWGCHIDSRGYKSRWDYR